MRPVANSQSALRAPLNAILGTEAHVRILRALAEAGAPLSRSDLARRTGLHLSGITRALATLERAGVVELVGAGTRQPAQLRAQHPLANALRALFVAERNRVDQLIEALRSASRDIDPIPVAAWLEGPFLTGDDSTDDAIAVAILAPPSELERTRDSFERHLAAIERRADVAIELRGRTRADLAVATAAERAALRLAVPLLGPPPASLIDEPSPGKAGKVARRGRSHADADAQARALAAALANHLRADPSLVGRTREWIAARVDVASPGEQRELREWDRILGTMSLSRLRAFLVADGERATRLRQTLPFMNVLSRDERDRLVAQVSRRPSPRRRRHK